MVPDLSGSGAMLSPCRLYRYGLWRNLKAQLFGRRGGLFVMLNPSTADESEDDATIRRCLGFIDRWGYRQLFVVNLFALRSKEPVELLAAHDPVGPENDMVIRSTAGSADLVVCAWGAFGGRVVAERAAAVRAMLRGLGVPLYHLGLTAGGQPRHPLYLTADSVPQLWEG